jgi:hypothetical protein
MSGALGAALADESVTDPVDLYCRLASQVARERTHRRHRSRPTSQKIDADGARCAPGRSGVSRASRAISRGYSHLKNRLARNPNTSAYPTRTSRGCAGGNWPTHESPIAGTAAPSGV